MPCHQVSGGEGLGMAKGQGRSHHGFTNWPKYPGAPVLGEPDRSQKWR
jgi:hypothetical protein